MCFNSNKVVPIDFCEKSRVPFKIRVVPRFDLAGMGSKWNEKHRLNHLKKKKA